MKSKILFLDTETGGIDPEQSDLLSIGLVVWGDNKLLNRKEILVKANPEKVSEQALKVNKINLNLHNKIALEKEEALNELLKFIKENFYEFPVKIGGHNVNFDISFLKKLFKDSQKDYEAYFSHRVIDTSPIIQFLSIVESMVFSKRANLIESSDQAFKKYEIKVAPNERHTALGDAEATARLFSKLINEKISLLSHVKQRKHSIRTATVRRPKSSSQSNVLNRKAKL